MARQHEHNGRHEDTDTNARTHEHNRRQPVHGYFTYSALVDRSHISLRESTAYNVHVHTTCFACKRTCAFTYALDQVLRTVIICKICTSLGRGRFGDNMNEPNEHMRAVCERKRQFMREINFSANRQCKPLAGCNVCKVWEIHKSMKSCSKNKYENWSHRFFCCRHKAAMFGILLSAY